MRPKLVVSYNKDGKEPLKDRIFSNVDSWADVHYLDPETEHPNFFEDKDLSCDLYHMARTRDHSLTDLYRAEKKGIKTINPYKGAKLVDDRFESIKVLENYGVKVPKSFFGSYEEVLQDGAKPPFVTKPRYEGEGHGILFSEKGFFEGKLMVQEFIDYDSCIKLYGIGDDVRAVKLSGLKAIDRDYNGGSQIEVEDYMADMVEQVSEITGLKLFELDVLEKDSEFYVVDVNSMIGLQNVSDAVEVYNKLLWEYSGLNVGEFKEFFPKIVF